MSVPSLARSGRTSAHPSGRRLRGAVPVAVIGIALGLAGCAGSSIATTSGEASSVAGPAAASAAATGAVDAPASDVQQKDTGATSYAVLPAAAAADRSIVVRADMAVRVADVQRATGDLGALAVKHRATIASQSSSAGTSTAPAPSTAPDGSTTCPSTGCPTSYASSTTTLRLDNDQVDALLADVATLGSVETTTRTSDDVTADVADVGSRVRNAQASVARIRALMSQATRIGDVVTLEGELSKRQADLEALEARQRALADQTAQATVTVRLYGSSAPVATTEAATGFLAGLRSGWDAFTGFMAGALTVLGALVPWLLLLVPLALLVVLVVRRRRETPNLVDQAG